MRGSLSIRLSRVMALPRELGLLGAVSGGCRKEQRLPNRLEMRRQKEAISILVNTFDVEPPVGLPRSQRRFQRTRANAHSRRTPKEQSQLRWRFPRAWGKLQDAPKQAVVMAEAKKKNGTTVEPKAGDKTSRWPRTVLVRSGRFARNWGSRVKDASFGFLLLRSS